VSRRAVSSSGDKGGPALHHNPLADEQILEQFYRPTHAAISEDALAPTAAPSKSRKGPRPTHYKIVCISLYTDDIERLERMVDTLKRRGHTKANKSQLIRAALDQVDLDKVPRSH
jgi:hypothetical protein